MSKQNFITKDSAPTAALELDEALSKRDEINERLLRTLDAATAPWGTKIARVELKGVRPLEDVQVSMAKHPTADRERRAAILRTAGIKQAAILGAEGQKQSQNLAAAQEEPGVREQLAETDSGITKPIKRASGHRN